MSDTAKLIDQLCEIAAEFGIQAIAGTDVVAKEAHTRGVEAKRRLLDHVATAHAEIERLTVRGEEDNFQIASANQERDIAVRRATAAEAEVERLREALRSTEANAELRLAHLIEANNDREELRAALMLVDSEYVLESAVKDAVDAALGRSLSQAGERKP